MERGTKLQQQIVIGTPGTVLDWCTKYKFIDPKKITMFVLDEADVMIATQGHRDQSLRIHRWGRGGAPPPPRNPTSYTIAPKRRFSVAAVHQASLVTIFHFSRQLTKDCQMLLFSATFEESVWRFAEQVVPDPNIIRLKREEETLDNIQQFYVVCKEKEDKFAALCELYGCLTIAQAMIFCHVSPLSRCS